MNLVISYERERERDRKERDRERESTSEWDPSQIYLKIVDLNQ